MLAKFTKWDLFRFPFICFWISWSILMPEDGLFTCWPFYLVVIVSIITSAMQLKERVVLKRLLEEHEDRREEWRKKVEVNGNELDAWRSIGRYVSSEQASAKYAKILIPFLNSIPSWAQFVKTIDREGVGTLKSLAEWVYFAERGKVSGRYVFPSGQKICEMHRKITPEMREDFFLAISEELCRHGVGSEPIVMVNHNYCLLRKYIKLLGKGKTDKDSYFNWVVNCPGSAINNIILRGYK